MKGLFLGMSLLSLLLAARAQPKNVTALLTSYGFDDNCPPSADISHPTTQRPIAGGSGTYSDPITFAGSSKATKPGTIIYVFQLSKYFAMGDDCSECDDDWKKSKKYHFDLWMGPPVFSNATSLIACENAVTADKQLVEVDASPDYPVNTTPLFNNVTNSCIVPSTPCHDVGTVCGNSCEIPATASCSALEAMFHLTSARFRALNPQLNCTKSIKAGTSVCQGGSCGD